MIGAKSTCRTKMRQALAGAKNSAKSGNQTIEDTELHVKTPRDA
jgi:hypothetical protein